MTPTTAVRTTELQAIKLEINTSAAILAKGVHTLTITDGASYAKADFLLTQVGTLRKRLAERVTKITAPLKEALSKVKESMREMDGFVLEIDHPLETYETRIRTAMSDYRKLERQKIQAEEEARRVEDKRLAEAQAEALAREAAAKTEAMRQRLAIKRQEIEQKREEVAATPIDAPVKVAGSTTRVIWKAHVTDTKALRAAVVAGKVPEDVCPVDLLALNRLAKANHEIVAQYPGVEVYEDVTIVRKPA